MDDIFDPEWQVARFNHCRLAHKPDDGRPTLPAESSIRAAEASLASDPSLAPTAPEDVVAHITSDILPALTGQAHSSRYYGLVTGGSLPIAQWADTVVGQMDQNVSVHLPAQTVATTVEDRSLRMLSDLLGLGSSFTGRTFTTGATASNVLGLACGREAVLARKGVSVGELGVLAACVRAGIEEIQVLTSGGHSSLSKAASVVGLGRAAVKELGVSADEPWKLDLDAVEEYLKRPRTATVISVSAGEVNTGRYAIDGYDGMRRLRTLADQYGAWIHLDGAFGIFARALDDVDEYKLLHQHLEGVELADSITIDGHKILNVPYDCGMFFTRSAATLDGGFSNPNAAYLSSSTTATIPSPLNIGIENSRRFRALPVYAVLLSEGRSGIARMVSKMVRLSRRIASFIQSSEHYDLLPGDGSWDVNEEVFIIVLFRARDPHLNNNLVEKINSTRQMYVGGTSWQGSKAARVAVSNWKVDVEKDYQVVVAILTALAEGREFDIASI